MKPIAARVAVPALAALAVATACIAPRRDHEVRFRNDGVTLAGTLSLPDGARGRAPVVVLISGDGFQDRDGEPGSGGLPRAIADRLVESGIAVLRHDDRTTGRSSTPRDAGGWRARIGDTRAAIAFVRSRADLDPDRVALIGHSEGGKTAAVLAAEDPRLAAIVTIGGATAVNVDSLLLEQAVRLPQGPAGRLLAMMETARSGAPAAGPDDQALVTLIRDHLAIAPRDVLPGVRCPVLILQGEADHLVATHHARDAAAVMTAAGNARVTVRTFPGLSHVLNRWQPGQEPAANLMLIDAAAVDTLATWLGATLRPRKET